MGKFWYLLFFDLWKIVMGYLYRSNLFPVFSMTSYRLPCAFSLYYIQPSAIELEPIPKCPQNVLPPQVLVDPLSSLWCFLVLLNVRFILLIEEK